MDRKKIILAEDDRMLAVALKDAFTRVGYDAEIAYDGMQALNRLLDEPFDLVVAEADVARVTAFEIKKNTEKNGKKIPFIGIFSQTQKALAAVKERAFDEVIVKPFRAETLLADVEKTLETNEERMLYGELLLCGQELCFCGKERSLTVTERTILERTFAGGESRLSFEDVRNTTERRGINAREYVAILNDRLEKIGYPKRYSIRENGWVLE